ncbi:MAG: hypothetical protein A2V50_06805 [Bacteroidetes bacterium RBG_19FT_COMBO_42_10]|nr:MAG: hypothetical protein A2V50_06805 [Bacteroidetes bacterium RBG_19FT_COMBO_42_10]
MVSPAIKNNNSFLFIKQAINLYLFKNIELQSYSFFVPVGGWEIIIFLLPGNRFAMLNKICYLKRLFI